MSKKFTIPIDGNDITDEDVKKGIIRITAGNKSHFPTANSVITVRIGEADLQIKYTYRKNKSCLIHMGKSEIERLGVVALGSIYVTKEGYKQYRMIV